MECTFIQQIKLKAKLYDAHITRIMFFFIVSEI
jgi:hypothetical protein